MERENKYDELYIHDKQSSRSKRLLRKYAVKPYAAEFKTLYILAMVMGGIFQILSLITAVTLPASWVHAVFYNWGIGFLIAAVLLFGLEILKRILVAKAFKNYFQFKKKTLLLFAALPSIASIVFSVLGTPILIREFGAAPQMQDTSMVAATFNAQIKETVNYWDAKQAAANDKADEIHKQNNWKNVTVRDARDEVLNERKLATAYGDSSSVHKTRLEREKSAAIAAILGANTETIEQDKQNKEHAGMMLGAVTFGFELLFILALAWCERYDFREALYISSQSEVIPDSEGDSWEKSAESMPEAEESGESMGDNRNRIGFVVGEGTIKQNKSGTLVIAYAKAKGGVNWYRDGQLSSQITDAEKKGHEERASKLRNLQRKLRKEIKKRAQHG